MPARRKAAGWVALVSLIMVSSALAAAGTWATAGDGGAANASPGGILHEYGGLTSPFLATASGAGQVTLTVTSGDVVVLGQFNDTDAAGSTAPTDTESSTWNLVVANATGGEAIWNATVATNGTDTIIFAGASDDPAENAGWAVEVANGTALASGTGVPPVYPAALPTDSVALFTDFASPTTACDTTGGTAWVFGCANTTAGVYTTGMAQNVSAGVSPELDSNNSGSTPSQFVWVEIAPPTLPNAPTGLTAATQSSTEIDLAWTDPPGPLTGTTVYTFQSDCSTPVGSPVPLGPTADSYAATGLAPATGYCFDVTASNSTGEGPASSTAAATTYNSPPPPPTGLNATTVSDSEINLAWTNPSGVLTDNHVYWGTSCASLTSIDIGAVVTSYDMTGLVASTSYCFEVSASTNGGEGALSSSATNTTFNTLPGAPTGLSASTDSTSEIGLAWTNPGGSLTDNHVYEYNSGCSSLLATFNLNAAETGYSVMGLTASTSYCFEVTASTNGGEGPPSSPATNTTFNVPPGAPTGLTATTESYSQMDLAWTNPSGVLTDNHVYWGTSCSSLAAIDLHAVATSYDVTGLSSGTAYCFEVTASTNGGEGPQSSAAHATTLNSPPPPPTGLTATPVSDSEIDLEWTNPTGALTDNHVYWGTSCTSLTGVNLHAVVTTFDMSALAPATSYCFEVSASTNGGEGNVSVSASATTFNGPPGQPTMLTATPVSNSEIDLAWMNPGGALTDNHVWWGTSCGSLTSIDIGSVVTSYDMTGLAANESYCFEVSASTDGGVGPPSASATATTYTPSISLSGMTGFVGSAQSVTGTYFDPSTAYNVTWDSALTLCTGTTNPSGGFRCTFVVPSTTSGTHRVTATERSFAPFLAFIVTPSFSLSPAQGPAGTFVTATGNGFGATASYDVGWDGGSVLCTGTTDSSGALVCSFTLPPEVGGTGTIAAIQGSNQASADFVVITALTSSAASGTVGSAVTLSASGFAGLSAYSVTWNSTTTLCNGTTNASGGFFCAYTVPAAPLGAHTVTAIQGSTSVGSPFSVIPSIALSSTNGEPGASVVVTGYGYSASSKYVVTWDQTVILCAGSTNTNGGFTCSFVVPASTSTENTVSAPEGAYTPAMSFTVLPPPPPGPAPFPWWEVVVGALVVAGALALILVYERRRRPGTRPHGGSHPPRSAPSVQPWAETVPPATVGTSAAPGSLTPTSASPPSSAPTATSTTEPEDIDQLISRLERMSQEMFKKTPKELGAEEPDAGLHDE